jgi:hypothetical protein
LASSRVKKVSSYWPLVAVLQNFFFFITDFRTELAGAFVLGKFFQLGIILTERPAAYHGSKHAQGASIRYAAALLANIRIYLKCITRKNPLAFWSLQERKRKKCFITLATSDNVMKLYFFITDPGAK